MLITTAGAETDFPTLKQDFFFPNGMCVKNNNISMNNGSCSCINSCINFQFLSAKTEAKFVKFTIYGGVLTVCIYGCG